MYDDILTVLSLDSLFSFIEGELLSKLKEISFFFKGKKSNFIILFKSSSNFINKA
jgi:hypothetical protein